MITTRYYYNKLNERDKMIYKAIYEGIMHYDQFGIIRSSFLLESMQCGMQSVMISLGLK